jgi:hypothetical protein
MSDGSAEEWCPVHGFEGLYEITRSGRVRSLDRWTRNWCASFIRKGRELKPYLSHGYPVVALTRAGKSQGYRLHVLLIETFGPPRPSKDHIARHLNDIRTDFRLENLAWGTQSDNRHDSVRNGRHPMAIKTHCKYGHEYTPENTQILDGRRRKCRKCYSQSNPGRDVGPIPDRAHGTRHGYSYYVCRCQPCRDANAAYQHNRLARKAQSK